MSMKIDVQGFQTNVKTWNKELYGAILEHKSFVLLYLLLFFGALLGVLYAKSAGFETIEGMDFLLFSNFEARASQSFLNLFAASFASSFLFLFLCFLCGLSMWGAFFIPVILIFRGFGLGLTSGYLYAIYTGKGVLFYLTVLLPGAFVCCIALLLAAGEGIRFSRSLFIRGSAAAEPCGLRLYILHFGAALALAFCASLVDVLLTVCFGGFFVFT